MSTSITDINFDLETEIQTSKEQTKTLPCTNCRRGCVVNRFKDPKRTLCSACRDAGIAIARDGSVKTGEESPAGPQFEFNDELETETLTDSAQTKEVPCIECQRRCVVTLFATASKVKCNTCRGKDKHQKREKVLTSKAHDIGAGVLAQLDNLADGIINAEFRAGVICPMDDQIREKAWLAGLLEGEGSFHLTDAKSSTCRHPVPTIALSMCDDDVVRRAAFLMGGYAVSRHKQANPDHSDFSKVTISGWPALDICLLLRPFMWQRRGLQIDELLGSDYARYSPRGHRHKESDIASTISKHFCELKYVCHNPNYGPRHFAGWEKGVPKYNQQTGETVNYQCTECNTVISFSTTNPNQMQAQNEARKIYHHGPSTLESILGVRTG